MGVLFIEVLLTCPKNLKRSTDGFNLRKRNIFHSNISVKLKTKYCLVYYFLCTCSEIIMWFFCFIYCSIIYLKFFFPSIIHSSPSPSGL